MKNPKSTLHKLAAAATGKITKQSCKRSDVSTSKERFPAPLLRPWQDLRDEIPYTPVNIASDYYKNH
jgi:hypothetical protein